MNEVANGKTDIETLTIQTKFHNQLLNGSDIAVCEYNSVGLQSKKVW